MSNQNFIIKFENLTSYQMLVKSIYCYYSKQEGEVFLFPYKSNKTIECMMNINKTILILDLGEGINIRYRYLKLSKKARLYCEKMYNEETDRLMEKYYPCIDE